jgi:hypothetical protein
MQLVAMMEKPPDAHPSSGDLEGRGKWPSRKTRARTATMRRMQKNKATRLRWM